MAVFAKIIQKSGADIIHTRHKTAPSTAFSLSHLVCGGPAITASGHLWGRTTPNN
jgi:hypothetical protein